MNISNNALRELENVLHRSVLLPLREIVLRRVAASLWINVLLSTKVTRLNWNNYEDKVKDKASKVSFGVPKILLIDIIKPLGSSILRWLIYHEYNFDEMRKDVNLTILKHLHWTNRGSINYKKTAKTIVELEMFSVEMRYRLACWYCLEDNIPILWEKLPNESKQNFHKDIKVGLDMQLEHYWAYLLSGEEYKLDIDLKRQLSGPTSFNQFAFKVAAVDGNKAATEYFFQKLTNEEREFCLLNTLRCVLCEQGKLYWGQLNFSKENLSVVICYLLSQMRPQMLTKILNFRPCDILICFLDWPLRDLFLDVTNIIWPFMYVSNYARLLSRMHKSFVTSNYCPKLFYKFFLWSTCDFKKKFVDLECKFGYFLPKFFTKGDFGIVEEIFRHIDAPERVRLVFSEHIFKLLCDLMSKDKWFTVEECLRAANLSNEDRQRFKTNCLKFLATTEGGVSAKDTACKRKRVFELSGESYIKSPDDGSSDDEILSRVKKHCSDKKANVLNE